MTYPLLFEPIRIEDFLVLPVRLKHIDQNERPHDDPDDQIEDGFEGDHNTTVFLILFVGLDEKNEIQKCAQTEIDCE